MIIDSHLHYVGVNDRLKHRFEGIWPLPHGVSYNSYLLVDEKVALIDTVDLGFFDRYLQRIEKALQGRTIDYLIINHMEPDHSGAIRQIARQYPTMRIVGNAKTLDLLKGFYGSFDELLEVKEGSTLSLGTHQLHFYMTPMIHWPETMMTYETTTKTLFAGDGFGSFGSLDGGCIDRQINTDHFWSEMVRYYANIVGKYGSPVQKALQKLTKLEIKRICSTHGPVWETEVARVIDTYDRLSRYEGQEGVVIAYGSMYGNTEAIAEAIAQGVVDAGIRKVCVHNLTSSDPSYVLRDIFDYRGLIIGSPTYNNGLMPQVHALIEKIESRNIQNRLFACFGGHSWGSAAIRHLHHFAERMKWEPTVEPIDNRQGADPTTLQEAYEMGFKFGQKIHQETR